MAEARLSQIAWGLFLSAASSRGAETPSPCRKNEHFQRVELSQACLTGAGELRGRVDMAQDALLTESGTREGHLEGGPKLPGLTQNGEPFASTFPQDLFPMAPFMCAPAFIHEALITQPKVSGGPDGDMAGSHLVSQDPQPYPQCLACLIPNHPLLLCPRVFIPVYYLSTRRPQYPAHRKPASRAWRSQGPLSCLSFPLGSGTGVAGGERKAVCSLPSS